MQLAQGMARLGTESAFEVLARAKALEAQGRDIINLGVGQPDFSTPRHIVEAAKQALDDGHHGYTPPTPASPDHRPESATNLPRPPTADGGDAPCTKCAEIVVVK